MFRKTIFLLMFFLFASLNTGAAKIAYAGELKKTPLENTGKLTGHKTMETYLKSLASRDNNITVTEIGKSDKHEVPLYMVTVDKKDSPVKDKLKVMIIARIHGSEPAGMEAALSFIRDLSLEKDIRIKRYLDNIEFHIIPCLNPDGAESALEAYRNNGGWWDKQGRRSGKGIDINRDFHAMRSREAQICVSAFNRLKPDVVIDLHEFSSIPIVVAGKGWWRAKYFDVLMGAGRHPDVYQPLAEFAVKVCEETVFPGLKAKGIRGFYYPGETGSLGSMSNMGVTAADYFNLRNSLTFLVETAGYDQGEETLKKRAEWHIATLDLLLDEICKNRKKIIQLVDESRKFASERETITLKMTSQPVEVEIDGTNAPEHSLKSDINVNGKTYYSKVNVRFRRGDRENRKIVDLPSGYMVSVTNKDFIEKLMLHGIKVYEALTVVRNKSTTIPAHAFYVPADQESSAIIGNIMDPEAVELNRYPLMDRVLIMPVELSLDLKNFRQIESPDEIPGVLSRFNQFMMKLMENMGVEDKTEDN